ncbi:MAG: inositol monophosphatase family protein [Patescibacteria group bacterium]|nr:inositol monophosphatase family protein [Patescibacteria group bacterium]
MSYAKEKKVAMMAAEKAGKAILKYFTKIDSVMHTKKSKLEILTPADLTSNKIIINFLHQHFPSYGVFSEESGQDRVKPEFLWVIDPLDGTDNFALGNPLFNISIALVHKEKIVLGVIYAPFLKQMFVAEAGRGVKMNGKRIHISTEKNLAEASVSLCYCYNPKINQKINKIDGRLMQRVRGTRNLGAAALDIAWVGLGRFDAAAHFDVHLWDVCAGVLIVKEAGGKATDLSGKEFNLKSKTLLVSNGVLHQRILKVINK